MRLVSLYNSAAT